MSETILSGTGGDAAAVEQSPAVTPPVPPEEAAPAGPGVYDYAKMLTADGGFAENWRQGLPEAVRNEKCLDSIKTIGTLAQSYVHAQHAIGSGKVCIPGANATAEEWTAYYRAGGMPESAEQYSVDGVELPEGVTLDPEALANFRAFAHEHGLSQKNFAAAVAYDAARAAQQREARAAADEAEYSETSRRLKEEFGSRFGETIAQCNKALETFGLTEVFRSAGLLNNYDAIKALASMGEKISESRLRDGEGTPGPADPSARLAEITGNRDDAYYHRDDPRHSGRVAEVQRLLASIANLEGGK